MIKARLLKAGAGSAIIAAGAIAYQFEGEHNQAYVDPVGVLTTCVGHTADVELGKLYSERECTERFIADLRWAESTVHRCTPNLPPEMVPALTSFTFNMGSGNYCTSTLAKLANKGDHVGACKQLYRWVWGNVKGIMEVLPGLVTRRDVEAQSCLQGAVL